MSVIHPPPSPYDEPLSDDEIRLFRLHKHGNGSISAEMKRFCLVPGAYPPFVATSYVWGDPEDVEERRSFVLNDCPTPVLKSAYALFEAMLSAEHHGAEFPARRTWWWMDCICINQRDVRERSAQVGLMRRVYQCASRTVIWLGEESEDSGRAMDFLGDLRGHRSVQSDVLGNGRGWRAIGHLFGRKWWERVWTLQEFLVGHNAAFFCGRRKMELRDMAKAIHRVWDWHQFRNSLIAREGFEKAWNRLRLLDWYLFQRCLPLVAMMTYTAGFSVTDPRDRIYSLLGLVSAKDREVVGRPDYESPAGAVYARFAKSFIEVHRCLDIICLTPEMKRHLQEGQNPDGLGLPSWVPDWSLRRYTSPPVLCMASQGATKCIGNFRPLHCIKYSCAYRASGSQEPVVSFSDDGLEMRCAGVVLGEIDGLSGGRHINEASVPCVQATSTLNLSSSYLYASSKEVNKMSPEARDECSIILEKMSRCLVLDRRDPYLNSPAPRYKFARECQRLGRDAFSRPERVPHTILEWFQENRRLSIRGWTIQEIVQCGEVGRARVEAEEVADQLKQLAVDDEYDSEEEAKRATIYKQYGNGGDNWNTFSSRCRDITYHRGKRLMVTRAGILGMASKEARKGDVVCVLLGCSIPVVLRPVPGRQRFSLVGECYVDGYMSGEAIEELGNGKRDMDIFAIV